MYNKGVVFCKKNVSLFCFHFGGNTQEKRGSLIVPDWTWSTCHVCQLIKANLCFFLSASVLEIMWVGINWSICPSPQDSVQTPLWMTAGIPKNYVLAEDCQQKSSLLHVTTSNWGQGSASLSLFLASPSFHTCKLQTSVTRQPGKICWLQLVSFKSNLLHSCKCFPLLRWLYLGSCMLRCSSLHEAAPARLPLRNRKYMSWDFILSSVLL